MLDHSPFAFSRRGLLGATAALAALPWLEACGLKGGGKTLTVGVPDDPTTLTSAMTSAGYAQYLSPKIFDGLLGYSRDLKPFPRLATAWHYNADDTALTLNLRPGVRWHDGKPFTSADVAWSALHVWKVYHSRGRMTYANLETVETPDPLTAVFRFSKPAPYAVSALAANESQVVPRHLYESRDVLTNPANINPVGTGPFRFAEWQRGQFIRLERNPDYWDKGRPLIDGVVFRIIGDSAALASALEAGEIDLTKGVPVGDYDRIGKLPDIRHDDRLFGLEAGGTGIEFNLDVPRLRDVRVRQAVAHAIDKNFILQNIYHGSGVVDDSPISSIYKDFHSTDVPLYPYDPGKAIALLDEAGLKPDANGVRLSFRLAPTPGASISLQLAEYVHSALGKVGIDARIESQDFATFVRRTYTDRDFDVAISGGQMGPDPVIGTQRFYWSKSFKPGVAFSNGAHYANDVVDRALEAAASEIDPAKRRADYAVFQRQSMIDLPRIPLVTTSSGRLFYNAKVSPLPDTAEGLMGTFADVRLSG